MFATQLVGLGLMAAGVPPESALESANAVVPVAEAAPAAAPAPVVAPASAQPAPAQPAAADTTPIDDPETAAAIHHMACEAVATGDDDEGQLAADAGVDPAQAVCPPPPPTDPDPLKGFNRLSFAISLPIDRYIVRPLAMVYKAVLPAFLRDGIHNALENIYFPTILVNDMLQLRPDLTGKTLMRFFVNSTLGLGGLFDVAKRKPFNTPAHANSFGDTLGLMGFEAGPYLYFPVMGPSSTRDLAGMIADAFTQPVLFDYVSHTHVKTVHQRERSFVTSTISLTTAGASALVARGLDERVRADADLKALKAQSVDFYTNMRLSYLQNREAEIAELKTRGGKPADVPAFDEPLEDPGAVKAPQQPPQPQPNSQAKP